MIMLGAIIYGANQQKATSNVTVSYSRPSYTVTFDPQGGAVSPSSKTVKLGDNYGDLPTPTKPGYHFTGWQKSDGATVTSTTQNTTVGNHTLAAKWKPSVVSYLTRNWTSRIGLSKPNGDKVESITFTKDSSKISGLSNSVSVGTNSETDTTAYVSSDTVRDVRAYWGSDKSTIVIYSPVTIYAPQISTSLFSHEANQYFSLSSLDLSNFDTSKVTSMEYMFEKCHSLTNLNLGNFNLASCTNFGDMLYNCYVLTSITLPYNLKSGKTIDLPASTYYNGSAGPYSTIGTATSGTTVACSTESNKVTLCKTPAYLTRNWTSRIGDNTSLNTVTTSIIFTKDSSKISGLSNSVSVGTNSLTSTEAYTATAGVEDVTAYWGSDKSTIVIYSPNIIFAPQDSSYLFTIDLNTSSSNRLSKLANLDLTNFNTSSVTDMSYMFYYCSSLTSLDVSNFDTSNVTNMFRMFYYCSSLTSLDLSNFNTNNVTNMSRMFYYCSSLTSLDVSNFNTSKVTDMYSMFYRCFSLTSLNVSSFDTSNVTNMSDMFNNCRALTGLDVSNFDTSNVTGMSWMFYNCYTLPSLDLSNFDTSNVTDMSYMFYSCNSLTSLDVSNFDTSKVTKMNRMFSACDALTSLDVSNFDTSNVTDMSYMFYVCSPLTSLNLGNFNLVSCTIFDKMLDGCYALASITLPYNLQSGKTIGLPAGTYYSGSAGPYRTIGTATSGTTVACSTASNKVILTKH